MGRLAGERAGHVTEGKHTQPHRTASPVCSTLLSSSPDLGRGPGRTRRGRRPVAPNGGELMRPCWGWWGQCLTLPLLSPLPHPHFPAFLDGCIGRKR